MTDAGLPHLAKLTRLKVLGLDFCDSLTDAGLPHLAKLTNLTGLGLKDCPSVTDAGVAALQEKLPGCDIAH